MFQVLAMWHGRGHMELSCLRDLSEKVFKIQFYSWNNQIQRYSKWLIHNSLQVYRKLPTNIPTSLPLSIKTRDVQYSTKIWYIFATIQYADIVQALNFWFWHMLPFSPQNRGKHLSPPAYFPKPRHCVIEFLSSMENR